MKDLLMKSLSEIQTILSEREYAILAYTLGFEGNPHNLRQTGKHFNITRECVRQLEVRALKKLRAKGILS